MMLTKIGFTTWLEQQDPDAIVGRARQGTRCPIATYMGPGSNVSYYEYSSDCFGTNLAPMWMTNFVGRCDVKVWNAPITAREALEMLK